MPTRKEYSHTIEKPPSLFEFGKLRLPMILGIVSTDRKLEASARSMHFPETSQEEHSRGYNFYSDLQVYAEDIAQFGITHARKLLYERLFAHLLTMDQEARRRSLTYPIPIHFEHKQGDGYPAGRVAGYREEWRSFLLDALEKKPAGIEKDRFHDEIHLTIQAFEELLSPIHDLLSMNERISEEKKITLLTQNFGYQESTIEVTPFLISLFPDLESALGTSILCYQSPSRLYAYTPIPFHLEGKSSFLYLHHVAYLPERGFVGLQQGMMSGYLQEDLAYIISVLTEKRTADMESMDLMKTVFSPTGRYSHLSADALFVEIKTIFPFKALAIEHGVNPQSCSQADYENYLSALETIFEHEIKQCSHDPEYLIGLQYRIERFSIYLAVAMGMTEKLPVSKMLAKYKEIYRDKQVAQNPQKNSEFIDTSISTVYQTLKSIPFRLESVFECSAVGALKVGVKNLGSSTSMQMFSPESLLGDIQIHRHRDFASESEAREFAIKYGINPEWIGDVIKYYPGGKECSGYGSQGKHTAHWVGQCGDHTMCLACNAEYNLIHGLVPTMGTGELQKMIAQIEENGEPTGENASIDIGKFVAGLGNPKLYAQVFLIETILQNRNEIITSEPTKAPLVA